MENYNGKSQLIKTNWELINNSYKRISDLIKPYQSKGSIELEDLGNIYKIIVEEWNIVYPNYVFSKIKKDTQNVFNKVQTRGFEVEKSVSVEINNFTIFYYIADYFNIYIEPNPRVIQNNENVIFQITQDDELNQELRDIFNELWNEITDEILDNEDKEDFFDEILSEFYDAEVRLLEKFLAEYWNKEKQITHSDTRAFMAEHTGVGHIFYLDEKKVLKGWKEVEEIIKK